ncbi:MAG TPA: YdcF family protein [Actinomycetota bacterium]|nr:YdcF family protein [Actinomycetota bacterium]
MGLVRRHPILSALGFVLLVVVALLGTTAFAVWRAAHTDDASRVDHADIILVLGAAEYGGRPSPVFEGRLDHAVLLFEQGRATKVMVLGGSRPGDSTTEAAAGREYLVAQGVPADAALAEPVGHTTLESLRAAATYMSEHGLRTAFLVSDPWHNLRIERMASDLGIEGHASATWTSAARTEQTRLEGYVRETFAYLYYRVFRR